MANDTCSLVPDNKNHHHTHQHINSNGSSPSTSKSYRVQERLKDVSLFGGIGTDQSLQSDYLNNDKDQDNVTTADDVSLADEDDELTKLNSECPTSSELVVKQKSATLTSVTSVGDNKGNFSSSNPFMYNARNNLRRSFTLPRSLLARKSGQTGPASENQNGNFVRNIFLTLVRSKSIRKKSLKEQENNVEGVGEGENDTQQSPPNKLQGLPPGFIPAAIGLKNQGNTCFMNSVIQCLSHTDSLAKYLVTDNYKSDLRRKHWIKNGKSEVTDELALILKTAWLRQNSTVLEDAVVKFKSAIEKGAIQWRGAEQHDAQEFFLWLLDKLHEDLNQASSNKYKQLKNNFGRPEEQVAAEALANHNRCNNSVIQDIFGAHFRSSLTCPGCGKQSATFDPFLSVSLPIPQAIQMVPVYVNIIYLSQQPRQVKLGLSVSSCADIKELKQLLAADTNIEENSILLTEVDGEGFHRTFTETQLVSSLCNNEALYCVETPQIREISESDGAFLMITWTNIIVTSDDKTKIRFGSTYVTQIARETGFIDLQKILLKEMSALLHPGILVSEQKDPVFTIRILDGNPEGSVVDPVVEHPLYMEAVDHALSLSDEDVPPHIKMHLEWKPEDKEKIIIDDSESVEEHSSVQQTRQKFAEESIGSVTLGECFDLYTSAEQLSAEDSWHCPHCNRKEQGTLKMIGLWTAPQVLVVHLKRFRQTVKGRVAATKISSVVDFPIDGLDLGPHVAKHSKSIENGTCNGGGLNQASSPINGCFGLGNWKHRASFKKHIVSSIPINKNVSFQNGNEDSLIYDLYAVCNHHGKDMLGGHYTAYCKNPVDESWWSFDDTRVTKLSSPSEIKTSCAYILFYTKRSSSSPINSQPVISSQHWCKSLIKKYHKLSSFSNSSNGDSHKVKEVLANKQTKDTLTTTASSNVVHPNKSAEEDSTTESQPSSDKGYHNNSSSKDSEKSKLNAINNAPLAHIEDIGVGITELQIESTV